MKKVIAVFIAFFISQVAFADFESNDYFKKVNEVGKSYYEWQETQFKKINLETAPDVTEDFLVIIKGVWTDKAGSGFYPGNFNVEVRKDVASDFSKVVCTKEISDQEKVDILGLSQGNVILKAFYCGDSYEYINKFYNLRNKKWLFNSSCKDFIFLDIPGKNKDQNKWIVAFEGNNHFKRKAVKSESYIFGRFFLVNLNKSTHKRYILYTAKSLKEDNATSTSPSFDAVSENSKDTKESLDGFKVIHCASLETSTDPMNDTDIEIKLDYRFDRRWAQMSFNIRKNSIVPANNNMYPGLKLIEIKSDKEPLEEPVMDEIK